MKKVLLILLTNLLGSIPLLAYDFMVDGLCYNKNSDGNTVTVTYQNTSTPRYSSLSGALNIPPSVAYSGITYSVTSIGYSAFSGCSGLTSVTIPNSVTKIGDSAFPGCTGLTSVTIGDSVTSIGDYAFENCTGLTSVTIGDSVTSIGGHAFNNCTGLTSVTIGDSVTSIGDHAFENCKSLTAISIPNSVTSIGSSAFWSCSGLNTVSIGNSVSSIVTYNSPSFGGCNNIETLNVDSDICAKIGVFGSSKNTLRKLVIGNSVSSITSSAFKECSELTTVTIGNSVNAIGQNAFSSCANLSSVTIGESVASIGDFAFSDCIGLTSVTIPNSVTSIGSRAFSSCTGLTSISIPTAVTAIKSNAFYGCTRLTSVNWEAIYCADFPSSSSAPFYNLTGIKTITFGNEVERIPANICYNLSSLESVTIPNSVTAIGNSAFYGCSGVKTVTNYATTPQEIATNNFPSRNSCLLFVPPVSLDTYKATNVWKDFIVKAIDGIPEPPVVSPESGEYESSVTVSISAEEGAEIRYTIDGSNPNEESTLYTEPLVLTTATTVKAIAVLNGIISNVSEASYTIFNMFAPTFSPAGGEYESSVCVRLACATEDAEIRYTVDGSTPTSSSTLYAEPFTLTETTTVKAIAVKNGYVSGVESATYMIITQNNRLYMNDVKISKGANKNVAIQLDNEDALIACEFYLQLPEGISIAKDDNGYYVADIVASRSNRHSLEVEHNGNGLYHFLCYSNKNNAFNGNSGDFISLTLSADENVTDGIYPAELKDVIFSDEDKNQVNLLNSGFAIEVLSVIPGDVNNDTRVNIMDIVEMVSYIMGSPSESFVFAAADLDGSGSVNVMDLVNLVEMIMTNPTQAAFMTAPVANNSISLFSADKDNVGVYVPEAGGFVAAQFTVELKDGVSLNEITTDTDHLATFSRMDDGRYLAVIYSLNNSTFIDNEPIRLNVGMNRSMKIDNIVFVNANNEAMAYEATSANESLGVATIETDFLQASDIYTVGGQLVRKNATTIKGLDKGIYIVNNKKVYVR